MSQFSDDLKKSISEQQGRIDQAREALLQHARACRAAKDMGRPPSKDVPDVDPKHVLIHGGDLRCMAVRNTFLSGAIFSGVDLDDASFRNADLERSTVRDSKLRRVDFRDADLRRTVFNGSDMEGSDFKGAIIAGTNFVGANLSGCNCEGILMDPMILSMTEGIRVAGPVGRDGYNVYGVAQKDGPMISFRGIWLTPTDMVVRVMAEYEGEFHLLQDVLTAIQFVSGVAYHTRSVT